MRDETKRERRREEAYMKRNRERLVEKEGLNH